MTCEKCGSDDVHTRYHGGHRECGYAARAKVYDMGEHLHRTCRGCGFDWATPALAAARGTTREEPK